jgi:Rieske Fe-S protein
MDPRSKRISRRALLEVTFAAGLGAGILGGLATVAGFLLPMTRDDPATVLLGNVNRFPVGSKTLFEVSEGRDGLTAASVTPTAEFAAENKSSGVWLVRLEAGFLALSAKCTHLGAYVPWNPDFEFADPATGADKGGWFRCPAHGATFNSEGVRVYGPAPRSLDRFDLKVVNGNVYMDNGSLRKGTTDNARYAVDSAAAA